MDHEFLKTREAAVLLNYSTDGVRLLRKQGLLRAVRIGPRGNLRFRRSDLMRVLSADDPPAAGSPVDASQAGGPTR